MDNQEIEYIINESTDDIKVDDKHIEQIITYAKQSAEQEVQS